MDELFLDAYAWDRQTKAIERDGPELPLEQLRSKVKQLERVVAQQDGSRFKRAIHALFSYSHSEYMDREAYHSYKKILNGREGQVQQ